MSSGIASYHSSVLLNSGSTSKITPRNGNRRCFTTWPIRNLAIRCRIEGLAIPWFISANVARALGPRQCGRLAYVSRECAGRKGIGRVGDGRAVRDRKPMEIDMASPLEPVLARIESDQ